MTHKRAVADKVNQIPRERLVKKITRTAFGIVLAGAGIAAQAWLGWPWWIAAGCLAVGAHIVSAELVENAVRFVVATVKDVVPFLRAKDGNDAP